MLRLTSFLLSCCLCLASAGLVHAQEFPGLGVGDLAAWNMQQDASFFNWAAQGSWEVARQLPDHISSSQIIGAMQPHTVDQTWGGYNHGWWNHSQRQMDAVDHWGRGAIRGEAYYADPYGQGYYLPYTYDAYHYGPGGYLYGGENPYGPSFYPSYPW